MQGVTLFRPALAGPFATLVLTAKSFGSGFTEDNLDDLAQQIKFDPSKAIAKELTQHGQKIEQVIQIVGANGKPIDVLFLWIRNNDGVVRLVTSTLGV